MEAAPAEEEKELVENELVLQCIRSRLGKYQESEERLLVENVQLRSTLQQERKDFADIQEYLKQQVATKTAELEELQRIHAELQKKFEQASHDHEFATTKLQNENASMKAELHKKTQEFNKKIKGTQDFLEQKEKLEQELSALHLEMEEKLRCKDKQLRDMERTHIQEKELWKRETVQKVKDAKAQMMQLTDNQLELTTKRTIMENEQMASELAYQSRQTEKMLHKNESLLDENANIKRQMDIAKETQHELAQRNLTYQRSLQKLLTKLSTEKEAREQEQQAMHAVMEELKEEKSKRSLMEMKLEEQEIAVEELQRQLEASKNEMEEYQRVKDETVQFLKRCMEDVRQKTVSVLNDKTHRDLHTEPLVSSGKVEDLTLDQRERALRFILQHVDTGCHHMNSDQKNEGVDAHSVASPALAEGKAFPNIIEALMTQKPTKPPRNLKERQQEVSK